MKQLAKTILHILFLNRKSKTKLRNDGLFFKEHITSGEGDSGVIHDATISTQELMNYLKNTTTTSNNSDCCDQIIYFGQQPPGLPNPTDSEKAEI